jgi:uncharacterized protein YndB with AHSA1/START domain
MSDTDRIEKEIVVKATRARVWRALTDVSEFNQWFGVEMKDAFAPGRRLRGRVTHPGYEHLVMDVVVERMDPEALLSFRWHPGATQAGDHHPDEERTLVVFELSDAPGGTRVRVVESGFDRLPASRRAQAFRENTEGWDGQLENIKKHVEPKA